MGREETDQAVPTGVTLSCSTHMDLEMQVILPVFAMLCVADAVTQTHGEIQTREVMLWLQQAGRDSAHGKVLNAMRRTGVLYIKVGSSPLLSNHAVSHFSVFLMFLPLSLPFFPPL